MRVNVYAEEMTDRVEIVEKNGFTGVRFYLELPVTVPPKQTNLSAAQAGGFGPEDFEPLQIQGPFMHGPNDDDSAAVTFWGKDQLKLALRLALNLLESHEHGSRGD